jgi:hypothetical protein
MTIRFPAQVILLVVAATCFASGHAAGSQLSELSELIVESEPTFLPSGPGRRPFDVTRHAIPLDQIRGGGHPIDGIPALGLEAPPTFEAGAGAGWVKDKDLVLGLGLGQESRPIPSKCSIGMRW